MVSIFQDAPGYMDADYYYAIGLRLNRGYGFSEPFLWNYLDNPNGIPHPSNTYWMPLPSVLAFLGMYLTGFEGFATARIGFLLLTGCIPVVTAALSYCITGRRDQALLSGILASIPVFYLPYLGTTDSFSVSILLGGLWFLTVCNSHRIGIKTFGFTLGMISGLIHLTRADGVIWLLLALLAILLVPSPRRSQSGLGISAFERFLALTYCIVGYGVTVGPWMIRNQNVIGTWFSAAGAKTLWLTVYDELYSYPASLLNIEHWWQTGLFEIVKVRLYAMGQNLQTILAVQGEIFLLPLLLVGLWVYRKNIAVQMGIFGWLVTFLVMTFAFPLVGWRGGFFHSGAFLQSLLWVMVPVGFARFIDWGVKVRRWNERQAGNIFKVAMVSIVLILTVFVANKRVIGGDFTNPAWGQSLTEYEQLGWALRDLGAKDSDIFLVNNAPGFFIASGMQALSVPYGNVETTLQVAQRYGGDYLLLERNHPSGLVDLYTKPGDRPGLKYLKKIGGIQVYQIEK